MNHLIEKKTIESRQNSLMCNDIPQNNICIKSITQNSITINITTFLNHTLERYRQKACVISSTTFICKYF